MEVVDKNQKPDILYMYNKMAEQLRDDAISVLESQCYNYITCKNFEHRYKELKEHVNNLCILGESYGKSITLPYLIDDFPLDDNYSGILSSVIMATGQLIAMIKGLTGSFQKEIDQVKMENIQLKDTIIKMKEELKKVKPAIPSELISKIPAQLIKTINYLNFNYINSQWDPTAMMTRKLISDAIDIKFRKLQILDKLTDKTTNQQYDLPKRINICANNHFISDNTSKKLSNLKLVQDAVTHSYKVEALPDDVEQMVTITKIFLQELFS